MHFSKDLALNALVKRIPQRSSTKDLARFVYPNALGEWRAGALYSRDVLDVIDQRSATIDLQTAMEVRLSDEVRDMRAPVQDVNRNQTALFDYVYYHRDVLLDDGVYLKASPLPEEKMQLEAVTSPQVQYPSVRESIAAGERVRLAGGGVYSRMTEQHGRGEETEKKDNPSDDVQLT